MVGEKQFCQLILTKPTIENITTVGQYELTQPRLKGVDLLHQSEIPILFGGGRDFLLGELGSVTEAVNALNAGLPPNPQSLILSDLFVLNSCVLIWFKEWERSLQIPYRNIVYHAVHKTDDSSQVDGHRLELLITVERDPIINELFPIPNRSIGQMHRLQADENVISTVELVLRPKYANFDRHYNEEVEDLFTFKEFGLNRGDTMVKNSYNAILTCMDFYPDEESLAEQQQQQQMQMYTQSQAQAQAQAQAQVQTQNVYVNSGVADDLDDDSTMDIYAQDGYDASMALQFYSDQPVAGAKRRL